uniref:Tyrosyl-DNA phosphodiesterase 1-like n=1 Tax=Phallusia mammillata TaxID=59560 RepID=A0A6F9DV20_9ASCI|nr:tyrosyl-DNA phosphodiesterase 1-like [Phallusia mammillata]
MDKHHGWTISSSEDEEEKSILPSKEKKRKFMSPAQMKRKIFRNEETNEAKTKVPCKFGDKCFRKNEEHLKEFSHTGKRKLEKNSEDDNSPQSSNKRLKASAGNNSLDPVSAYHASEPYHLLLTTVKDIPKKFNYLGTTTVKEFACPPSIGIKDILSTKFGKILKSAQFNYCIDIQWLMDQYPKEVRDQPILIVHGEQAGNNMKLKAEAAPFLNIQLCRADLPPFGTHHTKMMFLLYKQGLRIVISTSNLVEQDWRNRTQGLWMSPIFPKGDPKADDSEFKKGLLAYLNAYKKKELGPWIELIKEHDMSSANVLLVASVPGRHTGPSLHSWGHLKLRKLLTTYVKGVDSTWPVIGQFSSIGSLGPNKDKWVCGEWLTSMSACQRKNQLGAVKKADLKLIFPTVDNVRCSLDGYPSGASLPYSSANAHKQPWLKSFFHHWKAEHCGRSEASPHIKSYTRISPFKTNIRSAWFLLTSANLSKAAWGGLEKLNSQLAIKSYELGVLFIPSIINNVTSESSPLDNYFHLNMSSSGKQFYLPYSLPLQPYNSEDEPWTWDAPHKDGPDRFGNMWVPC